jgi:hypothetical protein
MKFLLAALLFFQQPATFPYKYTPNASRSMKVRYAFMRQTGYPKGRKGWVVDHVIPLCAGGADAAHNLQWQEYQESKRKDVVELRLCAKLRKEIRK